VKNHRKTEHSVTEKINPRTRDIDKYSPLKIIELISAEDSRIAEAVSKERKKIARAVDLIVKGLGGGGRLIFAGAGTSGRLGVLEASECPPTFGTDPSMVVGIVAGGKKALWRSREGAEDQGKGSWDELNRLNLKKVDTVVGISASSATPFVEGALKYARLRGCGRILISCHPVQDTSIAGVFICPVVGPEVVMGSTRMKAGTATKMVLNMLTTASMIRLGKTYGNLMVDVQPTSEKLKNRAKRIVMQISGISRQRAEHLLNKSNWNVKVAVIMGSKGLSFTEAKKRLVNCNGFLREALK